MLNMLSSLTFMIEKESYSFNYAILFVIIIVNERGRCIMNNEDLVEYLRGIVEIETSHYVQDELIKSLKKEIENLKAPLPSIPEPVKEVVEVPNIGVSILIFLVGIIITGFASVAIGLLAFIISLFNNDVANTVCIITAIVGVCITMSLASRRKEKEKFQKASEDYEERMKKYKEKITKQRELKVKNDNKIEVLNSQVNILRKKDNETNYRLKILYGRNIIYPKYQNYIAVCSLLEYFESGRFSTLPDAYNTYEIEVRLDKIITRLDIIIDKLDIIKNNQFQLYNKLTKANQLIEKLIISADNLAENMDDYQTKMLSYQKNINKSLENIYEESQISRYCNEQTQKELEFMNRMNIEEREERDYDRIKKKNKFHFN